MSEQADSQCEVCGQVVPGAAPRGMCPSCLLSGFPSPAGGTAPGAQSIASQGAIQFAMTSEELQELFPELEILDILGVGGMGAVYLARQKRLDRLVALKVLSCSPDMHEAFALRFEQEARLLAKLQHPHIVSLFDFGERDSNDPDGPPVFYFFMEYVEGADLYSRLYDGPLPAEAALNIAEQLCDALQYAHASGVVHRDIKPGNILIGADGVVKVADFGVARLMQNFGVPEDSTRLTRTGTSLGTPQYTAPEQWDEPEKADHRVDIFSLGVLLYEMLTGDRAVGVFDPPSCKADVGRAVDDLVLRAMNREPGRRFADAGEFEKALVEIRHRGRNAGRSWRDSTGAAKSMLTTTLVVLAIIGLPLWMYLQRAGQVGRQVPDGAGITPPQAAGAAWAAAGADGALPAVDVAAPGRLRAWGRLDNGNDPAVGLASAAGISDYVEVTASPDGPWAARRSDGSYTTYGFEAFITGKQWVRLDYTHTTCPAGLTSDGELWCLDDEGPRMISGSNDEDKVIRFATGSHLIYTIDRSGRLGMHFLDSAARSLNLDERLISQIEARLTALEDVVHIRASNTNAIAVTGAGDVISWHLGQGEVPAPPQVVDVVRVDCGANDYYAVDSRGGLVTWSAQAFDSIHIKPPEDLGKVVDLRVSLELCAAQFEDGSWRAWITRRQSERALVRYQHGQQLVNQINALGPSRDLAFSAKNEGALLYWIEPVERVEPPDSEG